MRKRYFFTKCNFNRPSSSLLIWLGRPFAFGTRNRGTLLGCALPLTHAFLFTAPDKFLWRCIYRRPGDGLQYYVPRNKSGFFFVLFFFHSLMLSTLIFLNVQCIFPVGVLVFRIPKSLSQPLFGSWKHLSPTHRCKASAVHRHR